MNPPIPNALANTVLLADHDEAIQRAVVDAVEKIIANCLLVNMSEVSTSIVSYQQAHIQRIALHALKYRFTNANIY
jgi:hypothetical protein